ncbi:hypothetical protein H2203_008193 [Taxawa tesnikishii (nom. ined.)]|nr:hypothetical protein H2203_008193 [Dothideales sp. JES 119]
MSDPQSAPPSSQTILRPPTVARTPAPQDYRPPSLAFLHDTFHVTHSSLPMWKSKRNVRITYTPLTPSSATIPEERTDRLDDLVQYQTLSGDKVHTVRGIDTASSEGRDAWDWRGRGWLIIAGSHWEVLGWGEELNDTGERNKWAVTYFAKTLFTPAGVDVYSSKEGGLKKDTIESIRNALAEVNDDSVKKLAREIFEIKHDGARFD